MFMKDEIPSHNTHEQPFMFNLGLNRLHVNFKFIKNPKISCHDGLYKMITNKIKLCPLPSAVASINVASVCLHHCGHGLREGGIVMGPDPLGI